MIVTGKIVDKETQAAIPFATVQLINQFGSYLGVGTAANENGYFSLASSLIAPPNSLIFSAAGSNYLPLAVDIDTIAGSSIQVGLATKPDLDPVTITFTPKKSMWWILLLPLLLMLKKPLK